MDRQDRGSALIGANAADNEYVARSNEFSLRTFSLSSVTWYVSVLLGWPLLGYAVFQMVTTPGIDLVAPLAMTGVLVVALELLPLVQGRGHDPQGVVMSTAFVMAMLFVWGPWPALATVAVASIASDLRARKSSWKVLFNPAQYTLSVWMGSLVMLADGATPSLEHPFHHFAFHDIAWAAGACIVYFLVNLALVAGVLAWTGSFRGVVTDDFLHYTAMTFAVLALSPLVVVVAQVAWTLLPLLLVPLVLLYHTAQMSLEREHAAGHDVLTGLANRWTLQFELTAAFGRHRRDGQPFGLMLLDLDDFKRINDTLGHRVGDELLKRFAQRLNESIRPSDLVARLGGDEFAVIVFDADVHKVRAVAEHIRAALVHPIELSGISLEIGLSLGIAVCAEHGTDGNTLLQRADVAMYVAKANRTGIEVYSADRDDNSADRLGLLGELRQALDDDDLELYYKPKMSADNATLLGVEALARWQHPKRGFVPPDEFIPLAEQSGLMPLVTERVITLALDQIARWRAIGLDLRVAVNIAPTDLVGDDLVQLVADGLRHHDVPAGLLQLEITERIVTHELGNASETLRRIREMGVTISLDDFGTGYSSLLRLSSLPVDEIKIDRVFVSRLTHHNDAIGVVRALIGLAHALGVPAIAEGVETQEERQLLQSLGCDGVQGWHVGMPMPIPEVTDWVLARTRVLHPHLASAADVDAAEAANRTALSVAG